MKLAREVKCLHDEASSTSWLDEPDRQAGSHTSYAAKVEACSGVLRRTLRRFGGDR